MDSFYEQPRSAPGRKTSVPVAPMSLPKEITTSVPDASMLTENHGHIPQKSSDIPYNIWKMQRNNKENMYMNFQTPAAPQQPSICRKQVRFESPVAAMQPSQGFKSRDVNPCPILRHKTPLDKIFEGETIDLRTQGENALKAQDFNSYEKMQQTQQYVKESCDYFGQQRVLQTRQNGGQNNFLHNGGENNFLQNAGQNNFLQNAGQNNFLQSQRQYNNLRQRNEPLGQQEKIISEQQPQQQFLQTQERQQILQAQRRQQVLQTQRLQILQTQQQQKVPQTQQQTPQTQQQTRQTQQLQNMLQTQQQTNILQRQQRQQNPKTQQYMQQNSQTQQKMPQNNFLQAKPFEKIYMANIPNRTLDLSIIEPPKRINTPPQQQQHKFTPIYETNHRQTIPSVDEANHCQTIASKKHAAESTTIETRAQNDGEPTVKDLLKIIQQQNEQLMTLQKQVTTLIEDRHHPQTYKPIIGKPAEPINIFKNKKFAVDVMTSFEVSIRSPNSFPNRFNFNDHPKITEITDGSEEKNGDASLSLNEPLHVAQEENQSPENSIHVDMQDYSSDEDTDETDHSSVIGWTIYNNVMDQVNFLLKKSQDDHDRNNQKFDNGTMKKVKEATLQQLKNMGVNVPNFDGSDSESSVECSPTEISCAVKQLLMKYLPDEQLAKFTAIKQKKHQQIATNNLIKRRPEFSLATVQYMEKYNLISKDTNKVANKPASTAPNGKLLDITALKQQPKLL